MAFIGPKAALEQNKIYPLEQFEKKWAVYNTDHIGLIENVCKHRQAIILKEQQDYQNILTCKLHGWTYENGQLLGEPASFFQERKCLEKRSTWEFNGLVFTEDPNIELDKIPMQDVWNPNNYTYHSTTTFECNYRWEYFIEALLDSYHIKYVHPGLSNFCDIDSYQQQSGKGWAFQTTNLHSPAKKNPSPLYAKWEEHIEKNYPGRWEFASVWLVLFPNVMIECYPGTCLVSSVWPDGENKCKWILHHYYEDDIVAFDPEFIELEKERFKESATEDDDLSERVQAGRHNLDECYTHPLESQIKDFYEQVEYHRLMKV
jgi:choline monooxygenase